jgi:hypothetical protein
MESRFTVNRDFLKMAQSRLSFVLLAGFLAFVPAARGLDVHLQELPPAPGLTPSAALDPLEGLREALNCGLDFLGTAQHCGLSAPSEAASPFLVNFDPLFCRLTLRFGIGELIDGLLGNWIAGAFARLGSPAVGALCRLGVGPRLRCHGNRPAPESRRPARRPARKVANDRESHSGAGAASGVASGPGETGRTGVARDRTPTPATGDEPP